MEQDFDLDIIRELPNRDLIELMTFLYTSGYKAGHHDTVESNYTDVEYEDMNTYFYDNVGDIIVNKF